MAHIKKLSVKTVISPESIGGCRDIQSAVRKDVISDGQAIMRVYGFASALKTGNSTYGDWTALLGEFTAVNLLSGEEYTSTQCFLPPIVQDLINFQLNQGATNVKFAFDISVIHNNEVAMGYEYACESLLKPAQNDAMAQLAREVGKALPPKKTEEKADDKK